MTKKTKRSDAPIKHYGAKHEKFHVVNLSHFHCPVLTLEAKKKNHVCRPTFTGGKYSIMINRDMNSAAGIMWPVSVEGFTYMPSVLEWIFWKCSELISPHSDSSAVVQLSINVSQDLHTEHWTYILFEFLSVHLSLSWQCRIHNSWS